VFMFDLLVVSKNINPTHMYSFIVGLDCSAPHRYEITHGHHNS
jgi:hypothetical protein